MSRSADKKSRTTGLKKLNSYPSSDRKQLIDASLETISIMRQCGVLDVCRSSVYYEPEIATQPILTDYAQMNHLDTQYTTRPFYGSRKMAKVISLQTGIEINRKRV